MSPFDPDRHHRRSIRLVGYDYARAGAYFVTLCVQDRSCELGEINNGGITLSDWGRIAAQTWTWLRNQYPYVALDVWVMMPNHLHGIIVLLDDVDALLDVGARRDVEGARHDVEGARCAVGARRDVEGARRDAGGARHDAGGARHDAGGARHDAPLRRGDTFSHDAIKRKPLGQLIGAFKTVSTKRINEMRGTPGARFWQRNYYEHIVRDEPDMNRIRQYIIENPRRWAEDRDNPANTRRLPPPTTIDDYLADVARTL